MVYDASISAGVATVEMTFTSIGCPAIDMIVGDVRDAIAALPGVDRVEVRVVWDPPWSKDRITDRGRRVLQLYGVVS